MISVNEEFYSSPYYFFLRDKGDKYSLYFSVEETLSEARKKDEVIHFDKKKGKKVKNYLEKIAKEKKKKSTKTIKTDFFLRLKLVQIRHTIASIGRRC
jgi:hypothetical protein